MSELDFQLIRNALLGVFLDFRLYDKHARCRFATRRLLVGASSQASSLVSHVYTTVVCPLLPILRELDISQSG